jgi:hypothetical protein
MESYLNVFILETKLALYTEQALIQEDYIVVPSTQSVPIITEAVGSIPACGEMDQYQQNK